MRQHIFTSNDESFVLRDWGGYLCFLGDENSVGSKAFGVTAIVRMDQLIHDPHVHDDSDEMFYVLSGQGRQLLRNEDGTDTVFDICPGDVVFLTKNRWHGTSNFSADEQLDMLLINYFYDGQSDPHIVGVVPAGSVPAEETPYGSKVAVITQKNCGTGTVRGNVLKILPGKKLEGVVGGCEEFFFAVNAGAVVCINGEAEQFLPARTQVFLFKGETYAFENTSLESVTVFQLCALD